MTKKMPISVAVILMVLAALITFNASFLYFNRKYNRKLNETISGYSYLDSLLSVDEIVKQYYIGEIDDDEVRAATIRGYLNGIGDQYAAYMTAEEYAAFRQEQEGSSVGIGVNVIYDSTSEIIEVIRVLPDSPALEVGIKEGDILTGVEGKKVSEIGYYETLDLIRGEEGTTVRLTFARDGEEFSVVCPRREVKTYSVTGHVFSGNGEVGVIRISEFNSTTAEQFRAEVEDLQEQGCKKFVFDLRNNGGGELTSILDVLDYLLPKGPTAHIYYTSGESQHFESDESFLDAEVAVLVNGNTASAAELFTAALRDYTDRGTYHAVIVGTKTYGKGVLQQYFIMKDDSAFKISVGRYDPPYAENYDGVGILPEVNVELSEEAQSVNFYKLDDTTDNQLIAAVNALNS